MATRKKPSDPSLPPALDSSPGSEAPRVEETEASSFEESMAKLARIVEELESGELSLEQSLEKFEEGIKLARKSQARLDAAEARVEELLGFDADGAALTEEL